MPTTVQSISGPKINTLTRLSWNYASPKIQLNISTYTDNCVTASCRSQRHAGEADALISPKTAMHCEHLCVKQAG